ncbi:MAG: glycosyltransferase family 4 protein [Planctomycetota bacterium]
MKILLVAAKLTYSSRTVYTLELVRGLVRKGHQIEVAALGGPLFSRLKELGAQEAYQIKFNYFSFKRLLQFMSEFGPEIIHSTGGSAPLDTAARFSRLVGAPLIHTLHSWLEEDQCEELPRNLRGIVAVNEDLRQHLVNERDVPKGRVKVIPYGVDADMIVPRAEPRAAAHTPVVGAFGRLDRGRRYDEFLRAARVVLDRGESVHFMIAGEGPDEDRLRRLARELKLNDAVTFVEPSQSVDDMYQVLDVLVVVSDWGGVGLTLLEGMAHGLPVIATGGGEVFPFLAQEGACMVVPRGDTERLADAIIELTRDPERAREHGQRGRANVIKSYPHSEQIEKTVAYYQQVLSSSGV